MSTSNAITMSNLNVKVSFHLKVAFHLNVSFHLFFQVASAHRGQSTAAPESCHRKIGSFALHSPASAL